jgi:hypothetical protein
MSTESIDSNTDASASDTLHFIETPDTIDIKQTVDYSFTHNDKLSQSSDDLESEFSVVSESEFSDDSDYESHSDDGDDNLI